MKVQTLGARAVAGVCMVHGWLLVHAIIIIMHGHGSANPRRRALAIRMRYAGYGASNGLNAVEVSQCSLCILAF